MSKHNTEALTSTGALILSERHLIAARTLVETLKPKTDIELIVVKATADLLLETSIALLETSIHLRQIEGAGT